MKSYKKLLVAFAMVAGLGLPAQAQANYPKDWHQPEAQQWRNDGVIYKNGIYINTNVHGRSAVHPQAVYDLIEKRGLTNIYPLTGRAFSSGYLQQTGEYVGVEFSLRNGEAHVIRTYDRNNSYSNRAYSAAVSNYNHLETDARNILEERERRRNGRYYSDRYDRHNTRVIINPRRSGDDVRIRTGGGDIHIDVRLHDIFGKDRKDKRERDHKEAQRHDNKRDQHPQRRRHHP